MAVATTSFAEPSGPPTRSGRGTGWRTGDVSCPVHSLFRVAASNWLSPKTSVPHGRDMNEEAELILPMSHFGVDRLQSCRTSTTPQFVHGVGWHPETRRRVMHCRTSGPFTAPDQTVNRCLCQPQLGNGLRQAAPALSGVPASSIWRKLRTLRPASQADPGARRSHVPTGPKDLRIRRWRFAV